MLSLGSAGMDEVEKRSYNIGDKVINQLNNKNGIIERKLNDIFL